MQHYFQHYTEPSTEPIPATTSTLQDTVLEIPPGALTNNTAGVPILVACTKADLIDDNNDIAGAGAAGMGGMVKGKGGEWEERTDGIMQVLRTICLRCTSAVFANPSIYSYLTFRRRVSLLHNTAACYIASAAPVRVTHVVYSTSTFTWLRARRTASQPLPIHS